MPPASANIKNAYKRSDVYRKEKKKKGQAKLKRRLEIKKDEEEVEGGDVRKKARLAANVPKTIDNTRVFGSSYLTSDPTASSSKPKPTPNPTSSSTKHKSPFPPEEGEEPDSASEDEEEDEKSQEDDEDEEGQEEESATGPTELDPEGGIHAIPSNRGLGRDPKILLTTSAKATRDTYTFAEELRGIFPGGEFFKRPTGRGYELGRISRWASKRGYDAVIVINEDRKIPNAITIINLPVGPTAYFKLTSVELSKQISGHARPTPHSPELILNNFQTRLGLSIGKLFGSLFPPLPQFEGRQVVTLHNQRDFLFFRRHRYMFKSIDKTALQEIGPRFTLKLRWLRKGLPAVTSGGSVAVDPSKLVDDAEDAESDGEEEEGQLEESAKDKPTKGKGKEKASAGGNDEDDEEEEEGDEEEEDDDDDDEEGGDEDGKGKDGERVIPPLNKQGEFEWKWKPKLEVSRRTFFL